MIFSFYPQHEHNCQHVSHCPHLGGAALGTLVLLANEQELSRRAMHASLDAARTRGDRLFKENQRLQKELDQVKLELKLERQNKFATNTQKQESGGTAGTPNASAAASTTDKKKRGAPVGHPGWFRKTPTQYDWAVDVAAPKECPHCSGIVRVFQEAASAEHLQQDIIEGRYRVVLYRHEAARCEACGKWVQKAGDAEILNSRLIHCGRRINKLLFRHFKGGFCSTVHLKHLTAMRTLVLHTDLILRRQQGCLAMWALERNLGNFAQQALLDNSELTHDGNDCHPTPSQYFQWFTAKADCTLYHGDHGCELPPHKSHSSKGEC